MLRTVDEVALGWFEEALVLDIWASLPRFVDVDRRLTLLRSRAVSAGSADLSAEALAKLEVPIAATAVKPWRLHRHWPPTLNKTTTHCLFFYPASL